MTEMPDKARTESLITALRKVPAFADLSAEDLEWFIGHAEERRAKPGEAVTVEDSPAELMLVLLEGEIRAKGNHASARRFACEYYVALSDRADREDAEY